MNKHKICVYAICKNEEQFVDRWMDSVKEADLVVVTDTGSKDNTVELLRKHGAIVYSEKIDPWRFDIARNISLSHVPEDIDICVCVDLDEVLSEGWREKLDLAWNSTYTQAEYLFTWDYKEDGSPNKQFLKSKIHRRKDFEWIHPVHEILKFTGNDLEKTVFINGLIVNHYPDLSKPRTQYLPLLELSAKENPLDSSTIFWLGREYMYHKKYDLAIETLKQHLSLSTTIWNEEKSASMRYIATCYEEKGNLEEAKLWLYKAVAECPNIREPYLNLTIFGYKQKNWPLVYAMAKKALNITKKSESYLKDPFCNGYIFDDYLAIASYNLGLFEEAFKHAEKACALSKNNERLQKNLKLIEQKLNEVDKNEEA